MNINDYPHSVVLLFGGQGNPFIGMGANLWDINQTTRYIWDCASDISGSDIRRLCQHGPMNRLIQTTVQQLVVTAINVSFFTLCRDRFDNMNVTGACGHSVGEYSALYAAGVMNLETLFRLVSFRARLMNELSILHKGSMLVVNGIGYSDLSALIAGSGLDLDICCDNSPKQQVVGGETRALTEFTQVLIPAGYTPVKAGVSGAWHTRLMQEGCDPMRGVLKEAEFLCPQFNVYMNVTGVAESRSCNIKENLALHLTQTVKWTHSIEQIMNGSSAVYFLEISHKPWLCHLLRDHGNFNQHAIEHCRTLLSMPGGQM